MTDDCPTSTASEKDPVPARMHHMTAGDVLLRLPALCRQHRQAHGLSYRQAANAIGIQVSALHKLEHGGESRLATVIRVVRWMEGWV